MEPKFDIEGPCFTSIKEKRKCGHRFPGTESSKVPIKVHGRLWNLTQSCGRASCPTSNWCTHLYMWCTLQVWGDGNYTYKRIDATIRNHNSPAWACATFKTTSWSWHFCWEHYQRYWTVYCWYALGRYHLQETQMKFFQMFKI